MGATKTAKGPRLWVALDGLTSNQSGTLATAHQLHAEVQGEFGFKVNLDAVLRLGAPTLMLALPRRPIFVDLKMWNGARTMSQVLVDLDRAGVFATNIYALAGGVEDAGNELTKAIRLFHKDAGADAALRIYAVTILTHYTDAYTQRRWGKSVVELVPELAKEGMEAGADGVIVPGTTLDVLDSTICKVVPGLRPENWEDDGRHEHTYQPHEVAGRLDVEAVCGGPIMGNPDPVSALRKLLRELG